MRISTPVLALAVSFAALGFAAQAGTFADDQRNITRGRSIVHFGDLNIGTEQGAKVMLQRIEQAATKACGGQPTFSSFTGSLESTFEDCRNRAIERTVKQLGTPMVTRIYHAAKERSSSTRGKGAGRLGMRRAASG